jgi:hypothetical protein
LGTAHARLGAGPAQALGSAQVAAGVSRNTVPTPTPSSRAILRTPTPRARIARTLAARDGSAFSSLGLPSVTPSSLALASPAFTRSWIIERSNSANTPIIPNIARPLGVLVSSPCWCK